MSIHDTKKRYHAIAIPRDQKSEGWKAVAATLRLLCRDDEVLTSQMPNKEGSKENATIHNHTNMVNHNPIKAVQDKKLVVEQRCLVGWCKEGSKMGTNLIELRRWGIKLWKLEGELDL